MPPTPDPHWTAYASALLTPVVAIAAVWVAIMNARTARNKLKLDLFERRMVVLTTIRKFIRLAYEQEEQVSQSDYDEFVDAINDSEWVFDVKVHEHLAKITHSLYDEFVLATSQVKKIKNKFSYSSEEMHAKELDSAYERKNKSWKALAADEKDIIALMAAYLRLSH